MSAPLTDDEVRALGYEPTPRGWKPLSAMADKTQAKLEEITEPFADQAMPVGSNPFSEVRAERKAQEVATGLDRDFASSPHVFDGMSFAEDVAQPGPAVWGDDERVLWSPGEPLMIYGPQGVGKTTLAGQLVLARIGLRTSILGLSVTPSDLRVMYVAADRPVQAARSWRRMVSDLAEDEANLVRKLVTFWKGPLLFDIAHDPERLLAFCLEFGVGTFIGDSLKDLAMDLAKDETGSRVNRAWQLLIGEGIEVLDLHHPRKSQDRTRKPAHLDEVYGSAWLTAGHGSVALLWGNPGDPIVELSHLKPPREEVGPFEVTIDHQRGELSVTDGGDPLAILRAAKRGMAAKDVACVLFKSTNPSRAEIEKARRRLERIPKHLAYAKEGNRVEPTTYFATEGRFTEGFTEA